jgi:hypothetical protein
MKKSLIVSALPVANPMLSGVTGRESTSLEKLKSEAERAGFEIIKVNSELLERDNIYFLKPILRSYEY